MAEKQEKQKSRESLYNSINRRLWNVLSEPEAATETALQSLAEIFYGRLEELEACWFGTYMTSPAGNGVLLGPHSRLKCSNRIDTRCAKAAAASGKQVNSEPKAPDGHFEICVPVKNSSGRVFCVLALRSEKKQKLTRKDAEGLKTIAESLTDFLKKSRVKSNTMDT